MENISKSKQDAIDNLAKLEITYHQHNLCHYSEHGDATVVKLLLDAGLNPNSIYKYNNNRNQEELHLPIFDAFSTGQVEIVKLLIEYGANLNYYDNLIPTPIFTLIAEKNGFAGKSIELLKLIIEKGADVNMTSNSNLETPLIYAIKLKNIEAIRLLIDNNADVNKRRKDGASPLFISYQQKSLEITQLLIKAGATPLTEEEMKSATAFSIQNVSTKITDLVNSKKYLLPGLLIGLPLLALLSSGFHFIILVTIGLISALLALIFNNLISQFINFKKSYLYFFKLFVITFSVIAIFSPSSFYNSTGQSYNSSSSSSSSSSESHTCGQCGKSFSGNGWSTVGGEQFQQTSWSGYGYCSKSCAYDSQPEKWKHAR
ncbi:MAG: ankyrin repeat domain-containing protein [Bacteroidota bacterium]